MPGVKANRVNLGWARMERRARLLWLSRRRVVHGPLWLQRVVDSIPWVSSERSLDSHLHGPFSAYHYVNIVTLQLGSIAYLLKTRVFLTLFVHFMSGLDD